MKKLLLSGIIILFISCNTHIEHTSVDKGVYSVDGKAYIYVHTWYEGEIVDSRLFDINSKSPDSVEYYVKKGNERIKMLDSLLIK